MASGDSALVVTEDQPGRPVRERATDPQVGVVAGLVAGSEKAAVHRLGLLLGDGGVAVPVGQLGSNRIG